MQLKSTASILVLLLPLAGLILSRESFPHRPKAPAITEDDLFKKLNIEKFDRKASAPDFALKDLQGNTVRLKDLRGKVVFLNFWATWCPSCRLEMPTMEKLHEEFGNQGLVILAINYRERPEEIKEFSKEHHLTFMSLLDKEGKAFELYQAWSLPTTYLINKSGEITGKVLGYRDWHGDHAKALFRQLLEGVT
ncbi:TlpA family protein disulfide reductase [bacterium]|nr:MAG: TlpA family protein disulfide reductase [bacterium]